MSSSWRDGPSDDALTWLRKHASDIWIDDPYSETIERSLQRLDAMHATPSLDASMPMKSRRRTRNSRHRQPPIRVVVDQPTNDTSTLPLLDVQPIVPNDDDDDRDVSIGSKRNTSSTPMQTLQNVQRSIFGIAYDLSHWNELSVSTSDDQTCDFERRIEHVFCRDRRPIYLALTLIVVVLFIVLIRFVLTSCRRKSSPSSSVPLASYWVEWPTTE